MTAGDRGSERAVAVVGAGAAGLTAAIRAAEAGAGVLLLNAHPRVGLKILMSGGTRCNVTHQVVTERDFFGGSRKVVARILRAFTPDQTLEWFRSLGVMLKLEDTGKWFPASDDAATVLEALLARCAALGVVMEAGARVVRIERQADGRYRLGIQDVTDSAAFATAARVDAPEATVNRWIEADRVILSTGGLSFPRTGSDGTGYALATALGHSLVTPIPALTPLTSADALPRALQGVTLDAALSLWVGGRKEYETTGSFLFTHFGYSGPAALDLSRHWLRAAGDGDRRVNASFAPAETLESLTDAWVDGATHAPTRSVQRHLARWLPERVAALLCSEAGVASGTPIGQVSRETRSTLLRAVLEHDLRVDGTLGFEKAEVTAGGVPLAEVDPSTLESRRSPGLYLCGEILDVEGRLGGFNFQFAWSSGTIAGRAAADA